MTVSSHLPTEERQSLDRSGRNPALFCFSSAIVWLLIGSLLGTIVSLKFNLPDFLQSWAPLTFGRLRPLHLNTMIYGWSSLAMLGVAIWLAPRLVHAPLRWPRLAWSGVLLWNIGLTIGVLLLFAGRTDGMEWLELDRYWSDPWLVVGGAFVGLAILRTLLDRVVKHLYVSVWYVAGAFVWFPIIYVTGNLPIFTGVESGAVNWFYAHNALGFWLTAINLAAVYYLLPKILGRPIYSYQLSLLGFWALAFFYSLNGMHHLIGGPLPTWMISTSIVASVMMIIPVAAVAVNHHMTMVGRFEALRYSPALRFVVLGAIAYTAVSLQGMFTALREVNRITHFTHWTVGHAHVGVYAFVTFVLFGSIYYIVPRLIGKDWPKPALTWWHFWLVFVGIIIYVLSLTIAGVLQGLSLVDPSVPFQASVEAANPWLVVRTVSGFILSAGHIIFAYHYWILRRTLGVETTLPTWHEARPVLVEGKEGP